MKKHLMSFGWKSQTMLTPGTILSRTIHPNSVEAVKDLNKKNVKNKAANLKM